MNCFINRTGSYLPGRAVDNEHICQFLGKIVDEDEVKQQVLAMNGILSRHYAQDPHQRSTENVYEMASKAIEACLAEDLDKTAVSYLAVGSTYAPYSGPGIASIVHSIASKNCQRLQHPTEISSHAGICTSSAAAMVGAIRAIKSGDHKIALCVGAEHASQVLKSEAMKLIDDRSSHPEIRNSQWFMSVFLRFMLSDGAGAMLVTDQPADHGISLKVDWTFSQSMAHECPLCMKLDNQTGLLSQDVRVLNRYLFPAAQEFVDQALSQYGEALSSYRVILPHLSSFFFRRKMEKMIAKLVGPNRPPVPYWSNLATKGNTGAASIYIMLDEFLRTYTLANGDRILLFIPESGQFNFVLISLTAIASE